MKRAYVRSLLGGFTAIGLVAGLLGPAAAEPAPAVELTDDPVALGEALVADTSWVTGAAFETRAAESSTALVAGGVAGMPTNGPKAALLSTGDASLITAPNTSGNSGRQLGGGPVRGDTDMDVTILRVDIEVPETVNCLVGMDFRFLSEEHPEYVGSQFNDAFIAELDKSTWTTSGSQISAPDNFAFDPTGNPITINSAGVTSMSDTEAEGTTFDGATPLLTAATPLTPGAHSLYLSIFDQGDMSYDSAVIIDNLRMGTVGDVATECTPGAEVAEPDQKTQYVALGDSYSSGFGAGEYLGGTFSDVDEEDGGSNNCQRSKFAYPSLLEEAGGYELSFHACQGAKTKDFYAPRNDWWGEPAQLTHLNEDTDLVTFSIGGNDVEFSDTVKMCAATGAFGYRPLSFMQPAIPCAKYSQISQPLKERMMRLDNRTTAHSDIWPYTTLFSRIRDKANTATAVAVGYPRFFASGSGGGLNWLPEPIGRCQGITLADQRWMAEKTDELNRIIKRNARRHGLLYADPNPAFEGRELCGEKGSWFYPIFGGGSLLHPGRIHPTPEGHQAIADTVAAELEKDNFQKFTVKPQQTVTYSFSVDSPKQFISLVTGWPGSDVSLTLVSPSGQRYDRSTQVPGSTRDTGPTYEHVEVADPEVGQWTVELHGVDVPAAGEPVTLSLHQEEPENQPPAGSIVTRVQGESLVLDATGSTDPDGTVVNYDWYISTAETDEVLQGETITVPLHTAQERTFTLVVTDDRGATDFQFRPWVPIDVKPGSDTNPINIRSKGETPIALLSTETLDATAVDPTTIKVGPKNAVVKEKKSRSEDVNGDGRPDQVVHARTQELGLTKGDTQLCLTASLNEETPVSSCDVITVR